MQEPVKHIKIIMHADPNYLPYSIIALQFWNDVDIRVTSYKHSSIVSPNQLTAFFKKKSINSAAKTIIHLTLIWKQSKIKLIFLSILRKCPF